MSTQRKQVYGKRSRTVYDPFAIFGSPEVASVSSKKDNAVTILEQALSKVSLGEVVGPSEQERRALGERNVNPVLKSSGPEIEGLCPKADRRRVKNPSQRRKVDASALDVSRGLSRRTPTASDSGRSSQVDAEVDGDTTRDENQRHRQTRTKDHKHMKQTKTRQSQERTNPELDGTSINGGLSFQSMPQPPRTDCQYSAHTSPILQLSSHSIEPFSEWSSELSTHFDLTKIAEASFGEVYRLTLSRESGSSTSEISISRTEESVLKVIALTPPTSSLPTQKREREKILKKAAAMSKPGDVASEVRLLQRMTCIPGFTNFRDVRIVQGRPPPAFISAFRNFNNAQRAAKKDLSIFPDPARKTSYRDDQLWAVIEMQDAGTDLERLVERGDASDIWTVWDIFWQVVLALAKGEEGAEFEHRDLHLGNICVRSPSGNTVDVDGMDTTQRLNFTGREATLIDYTISRASMSTSQAPNTSSREPDRNKAETAFIDLSTQANDHLFTADSTDEYQYEIYRYMRSILFFDDAYTEFPPALANRSIVNDRSWHDFRPTTNLIWLHFVLYTLLEQMYYPSETTAPSRKAKSPRQKQAYAMWKRGCELEAVLLQVQEMLDPGVLGQNGLLGASSLVGVAIHDGWLGVEDVIGVDGSLAGEEVDLIEEMEKMSLLTSEARDAQVPSLHPARRGTSRAK